MAGGVVAALTAQGLAGQVPVSGQDGDQAALNRIALGTQTVSVWKDARELGKEAANVAVELAKGGKLDKVPDAVVFDGGPKKVKMNSMFLTPGCRSPRTTSTSSSTPAGLPRTKVCQGVPAGKVAVCG